MNFRASEWIVLAYFVYLAVAAAAVPLSSDRRRRVIGAAAMAIVAVVSVERVGGSGPSEVLRDWIPLVYLVVAYRLPASFVTARNERLERALLALDERWLGRHRLATFAERGPKPLLELFELAYLFCYPLVPMGLACLYIAGLREEANRFWTAVLLAAFLSYGALPWFPTRPPRTTDATLVPARSRIRTLNLDVLARASIQLNTFPSGHAATAVAAALAVGARLPLPGLMMGLIALGILGGSVLGRYHYAADALTGAVLALVGFVVSRFV